MAEYYTERAVAFLGVLANLTILFAMLVYDYQNGGLFLNWLGNSILALLNDTWEFIVEIWRNL